MVFKNLLFLYLERLVRWEIKKSVIWYYETMSAYFLYTNLLVKPKWSFILGSKQFFFSKKALCQQDYEDE